MSDVPPLARARPLSPHVGIWRWHVTMAASILTRLTGMALYGGAAILAGWALALAAGAAAYDRYMALLASPPGKVVLFGLTVSVFYHLAAGIRHLVWDAGKGFALATANATAWTCLAFALIASIALWLAPVLAGGA